PLDPELFGLLADPLRASRKRYLPPGKYTIEIRSGEALEKTTLNVQGRRRRVSGTIDARGMKSAPSGSSMGWFGSKKPSEDEKSPAGSVSAPAPEEGRRKIGKYEVLEKIATGGFGTVYKAWDPMIRR